VHVYFRNAAASGHLFFALLAIADDKRLAGCASHERVVG